MTVVLSYQQSGTCVLLVLRGRLRYLSFRRRSARLFPDERMAKGRDGIPLTVSSQALSVPYLTLSQLGIECLRTLILIPRRHHVTETGSISYCFGDTHLLNGVEVGIEQSSFEQHARHDGKRSGSSAGTIKEERKRFGYVILVA